ncbi:MAG: LysR family transcriptional regulator [Cytophagales bacterium]|nr:LysR family transcriptional regulator [Cytophagales bacterium]
MNLRFVEAFYWVATLKSVTRAAEKLHITQSAMSARIAALEEELGVLLLDRQGKQFRLTTAGGRFITYAHNLLDLQRAAKEEMGSDMVLSASLRVGAIESVLHSWLISWIEVLRAEHLGLALELTVETTPVLMDQVQRGAQDIVFTALPASGDNVRSKPLPAMPMCFVGNIEQHRKRLYMLSELAKDELMTFQRGSQPYVALQDALRQAQVSEKRVHAISSISAMGQLVQGGFGVATLPVAAAQRMVQTHGLRLLKCKTQLPPLPIFVSYRSDPATGLVDKVVKSAQSFVE